jgi:hypothetical protein
MFTWGRLPEGPIQGGGGILDDMMCMCGMDFTQL